MSHPLSPGSPGHWRVLAALAVLPIAEAMWIFAAACLLLLIPITIGHVATGTMVDLPVSDLLVGGLTGIALGSMMGISGQRAE